ncbi:MAG: glycoside hydrolase family 15 protein, partial [Acidimicrobiia bacterium]
GRVKRRYHQDTLVLETEFETDDGVVRVLDFMPLRERVPEIVRIVEGVRGRVPMEMEYTPRFDYGRSTPWITPMRAGWCAVAGPDALLLETPIEAQVESGVIKGSFTMAESERVPFVLTWYPSHEEPPETVDAEAALAETTGWWKAWAGQSNYGGKWRDAVSRSEITLKALTYAPTGGVLAAPTTSLPEKLGGVRNWDYRYCWLRDATFTLLALMSGGYMEEASAWRDWLLRAVGGEPDELQIMYGPAGERRLPELELEWLPGYEGSRPVRIGNAAYDQLQLDVFGEVMDLLHQARRQGLSPEPAAWSLQRDFMEFLESNWREPDEGIWEIRGPRRHFTHSKVMAWVAADRAIKSVEQFDLDGPRERWAVLRDEIFEEVCLRGWDQDRSTFTQYYGSKELDAALLMMPLVGFLPPDHEMVKGTVGAIELELCQDGFVHRYTHGGVDGLPPGEGAFLACTFWLVDNYALMGRHDEAVETFERLLALRNDVGLLSEEYDVAAGRLVGNFPQALTHLQLVASAHNLEEAVGPARERSEGSQDA